MSKVLDGLIFRWFTEDADAIKRRLDGLEALGAKIMASLDDVKGAIAAERVEVRAKLDVLTGEIQSLRDQIASGTNVTPEQLDELVVLVQDIFTEPMA